MLGFYKSMPDEDNKSRVFLRQKFNKSKPFSITITQLMEYTEKKYRIKNYKFHISSNRKNKKIANTYLTNCHKDKLEKNILFKNFFNKKKNNL